MWFASKIDSDIRLKYYYNQIGGHIRANSALMNLWSLSETVFRRIGYTFNMSLELARPLMLHPTFILRPTLAVDSQYLWQNGGTEKTSQGTDIYALSFRKMDYHRALFRAGFSSETTGPRGGIRMRAFYVAQFDGSNYPDSDAAFASGGAVFNVRGVNLGGEFLNLGVGSHLWLDGEKTASLFFDYDSEIYGTKKKTLSHTVQFGYLQTF